MPSAPLKETHSCFLHCHHLVLCKSPKPPSLCSDMSSTVRIDKAPPVVHWEMGVPSSGKCTHVCLPLISYKCRSLTNMSSDDWKQMAESSQVGELAVVFLLWCLAFRKTQLLPVLSYHPQPHCQKIIYKDHNMNQKIEHIQRRHSLKMTTVSASCHSHIWGDSTRPVVKWEIPPTNGNIMKIYYVFQKHTKLSKSWEYK